jgi:hypothetical protein
MRVFLSNSVAPDDFSDVLKAASKAAGIDLDFGAGQRDRSTWSVRSASSHLQQLAEREQASRASMLSASIESYLEQLGDVRAQRLVRTANLEAITDELGITAQMTSSDLNRLRRKFALANHPDRTGLDERELATRRMMIANMLIDRELKRRGHAAS